MVHKVGHKVEGIGWDLAKLLVGLITWWIKQTHLSALSLVHVEALLGSYALNWQSVLTLGALYSYAPFDQSIAS